MTNAEYTEFEMTMVNSELKSGVLAKRRNEICADRKQHNPEGLAKLELIRQQDQPNIDAREAAWKLMMSRP
jgi:hypothetical protein